MRAGLEARSWPDTWFGVVGKVLLPLLLICTLWLLLYQVVSRRQIEQRVPMADSSEAVRAIAEGGVMRGMVRVHGRLPDGQRFSAAAPSDSDLGQTLLDDEPHGAAKHTDRIAERAE